MQRAAIGERDRAVLELDPVAWTRFRGPAGCRAGCLASVCEAGGEIAGLDQQRASESGFGLAAVAADRAAVVDEQRQLRALARARQQEQVGRARRSARSRRRAPRRRPISRDAPPPTCLTALATTTIAPPPRADRRRPRTAVGASRTAACTPPKNRLRSRNRAHRAPGALERGRVDPRLGVDDAVLEVHARRVDRVLGRIPSSIDADDRLQDRRADPVGAGAAEHQLGRRRRAGPPSAPSCSASAGRADGDGSRAG